ncbi:MAG: hypothetical protein NWR47_04820, partial [Aestuariivirgaceae bacterium]|nr:hypothetical protein [Aestuariivirgaceae bacterium]
NDEVYKYDEEAFEASGDDIIYGGAGDDDLDDQFGNNSINGDDGNDFLYGSKDGMNTLTGGAGNDTFFFTGNSVVTDFQGGGAAGGDLIVLATEFLSDLTGDGVIDEADAVASFEVSGDDLVAELVVDGQTFTMTLTGLATTTLTTDDFITVSFG